MQDPYHTLISCLLPEGLLDYFDLTHVLQGPASLQLQLQEKNILPQAYQGQRYEYKGFLPEIKLQDFPIRGQKVTLCIKRRRWYLPDTGEVITRDWQLVQQGTRMTREFAAFLKQHLDNPPSAAGNWPATSTWTASSFRSSTRSISATFINGSMPPTGCSFPRTLARS